MKFIADLHIHSRFSRATSKDMTLENIERWAQLKGISVIGTGDFTHPQWFKDIQEKLTPAEEGLFRLRTPSSEYVHPSCQRHIRFILSVEISSIYSKNNRLRKVHNLILVPTLEAATKINTSLSHVGNLSADGRPILGLDSKDLLEICLESSAEVIFIPAHAWTPHFSVFGSNSGFDSMEECFEELSPHIKAIETGLSSDPPMNWRVKALDKLTLVSNSDAHSPEKIGREANIIEGNLTYHHIKKAIERKDGFKGTIEFFPEEGKYHFDGHRLCQALLSPSETKKLNELCPRCGKKVTVGVMHRVEELADRPEGFKLPGAPPYYSLVPLPEIIAQVRGTGTGTKGVAEEYHHLLEKLGDEFKILLEVPVSQIEKISSLVLAEAIRRVREGKIKISPGYDGEYGKIEVITPAERDKFSQQLSLF